MKLEIIQPFINAADAVFGHNMQSWAKVEDLRMETCAYRKHGIAAIVTLEGDVEGRVVLDLEAATARKMAESVSDNEQEIAALTTEVVCELANQVIGNAVTVLNDSGYRFRVQPPRIAPSDEVTMGSAHTETLVVRFETSSGPVFLNIALRARAPQELYAAD